ncbi:MAG: hypothetical protein D6798_18955 [Deltaproteobacteria bacterium]|nr:MAG: hypothetical protein D6798_18955 [Deltaproteobacteria bacterium]
MLLFTALAGSPVLAADLDLAIGFDDAPPSRVVLRDVLQVDPPQLVVLDAEGRRHLVDLAIDRNDAGNFTLTTTIFDLRPDRKGRLTPVEVASPRITVAPDQEARVTQGTRLPVQEGDAVRFDEQSLHLTATVTEPAPPRPAPPAVH